MPSHSGVVYDYAGIELLWNDLLFVKEVLALFRIHTFFAAYEGYCGKDIEEGYCEF